MGRNHVRVAEELGLELVGICDMSREALAQTADEHSLPDEKLFLDAHGMLEQTSPECVIVATTAPTHYQYTVMAAESGAEYILCEKPMGVSIAQCDAMLQTCRRTGANLAINHQMRFMEQYSKPKGIINSDEFGGLSSVTAVAGNIGMAMNGTHYFEMFRYIADESPEEVTAWFSEETFSNPRGKQFEDRGGSLRMTTPNGKRFYLEIGVDQGLGAKVVYSGPRGQLVVDELSGWMHLAVREKSSRDLPTTRYSAPWVESNMNIEPAVNLQPTRYVLQALLEDQQPPSGEDGRLAVALLVSAYVSHENGHVPVRPDDAGLPLDRVFPWA